MKITVVLKGNLSWHDRQRRKKIIYQGGLSKPGEILSHLGIPLEQVQMIAVNGELLRNLDTELEEGTELKVYPIIEGG